MISALFKGLRKPIPTRTQLVDVLASAKDTLLTCGTEEAEKVIRAKLKKYQMPRQVSIRFIPSRNSYYVALIANGFTAETRIDVPRSVGGL